MEELPLALEYGMSVDEFWNGDPDLIHAYREAYINKLHRQAHIQGLYNFNAYSVVLSNAFSKREGKKAEYPKTDIYNPLNEKNNSKEKTFVETIDTTKNNNGLYQLKRIISERRNT